MGCGKRIQSFQRFMSIASAHREVSPRMSTAEPPLALLQGSVAKLAWAIRSVDHYLAAHSEAVARLAEQIARQLGLSDSRVEEEFDWPGFFIMSAKSAYRKQSSSSLRA